MSRPRTNLRLFVAVYPPPELTNRLLSTLNSLNLPEHRAAIPEQVHLTLHFIGDVPSKKLDETIESVQRAASGLYVFDLAVKGLMTLPARGPSRLVAAETDYPSTLLELKRRLVIRLATAPRSNGADRYRPHLTLCRFKHPAKDANINIAMDLPSFEVEQIAVMRSALSNKGAEHHEIASIKLVYDKS